METELFTLSDLIARQPSEYYSKFGIEQVEQTYFTSEIWDVVCRRFNEQYYEYPINGETLEQWQIRLQVITDRMLPRLARIHDLQESNDIDTLGVGYISESSSEGATTGKSSSKSTEYPDNIPLSQQQYGGVVSTGDNTGSDTRKSNSKTTQSILGGKTVEIEESMRRWHDIITEIVDGYAKAFLSIIYY